MLPRNHEAVSPICHAGLRSLVSLGLLVVLAFPAFAKEPKPNWQISANPSYTQGDYGGDTTTSVFYLPFSVKRLFNFGELSVTVPFVSITSTGLVTFVGGDRSVEAIAGRAAVIAGRAAADSLMMTTMMISCLRHKEKSKQRMD